MIPKTSLYKPQDARTMAVRKSQGVGTLTVKLPCNVHGFKQPSMFILDAHLNHVLKSCVDKSCHGDASVFWMNMAPRYGIDDTIQGVTYVYILMSIFKFCSFHKVKITEYYNSPLSIVHFYN